jgi:hypothetical protein
MPSTVIASTEYDASTRTLLVKYVSGMMYRYKDVPAEVYSEMRAAFSKGQFLNRFIKGKYAFEKITGTLGEDLPKP